MFHLRNFPFLKDRNPNLPLSEIPILSERITVLFARNQQKEIVENNFIRIYGLVDMVSGLEYHFENFKSIIAERSLISIAANEMDNIRRRLEKNMRHEIIAYLNRIGQIYHFATSGFVREFIPDASKTIPIVIRVKFFRDKHAAHRSIDKPLNDDSHAQLIQAWGLSSNSSLIFEPKDKSKAANILTIEGVDNLWRESYLCLQIRGRKEGTVEQLNIEKEHPSILNELYLLAETLISKSK